MEKQCNESMQQLIDKLKQQTHNLTDELNMAHTHIDKLQQLLHNKNAQLSYYQLNHNDNNCSTVQYFNKAHLITYCQYQPYWLHVVQQMTAKK